jgi:hypothetical protein
MSPSEPYCEKHKTYIAAFCVECGPSPGEGFWITKEELEAFRSAKRDLAKLRAEYDAVVARAEAAERALVGLQGECYWCEVYEGGCENEGCLEARRALARAGTGGPRDAG